MSDIDSVTAVVENYFRGLHFADVDLLSEIFDPQVTLFSPGIRRNMNEWLALVASRPVPENEGHPFHYQLLSVELLGEMAVTKIYCPLLGNEFLDVLVLFKENNSWTIVGKSYVNFPEKNTEVKHAIR